MSLFVLLKGGCIIAQLAVVLGKVMDEVWTRLKGDPAKTALRRALGAAIQRYVTSQLRLDLARPLLEKDE